MCWMMCSWYELWVKLESICWKMLIDIYMLKDVKLLWPLKDVDCYICDKMSNGWYDNIYYMCDKWTEGRDADYVARINSWQLLLS